MRIKKFRIFENKINNSIQFPTEGEVSDLMSNFLDSYDKDIENYDTCYLTILKNPVSWATLDNSPRFYSIIGDYFGDLNDINSSYDQRNLFFTKRFNFQFKYPNWHITRQELFDYTEEKIESNQIKAYPIIKFDFGQTSNQTSSMILYKKTDIDGNSEINKEFESFLESLKFLYYQTGFRPFSSLIEEDYVDEDNGDVYTFLIFNGFFIDCDDNEYNNLYKMFDSEFRSTLSPTRKLFDFFLK